MDATLRKRIREESPDRLAELAFDDDWDVRCEVAGNENTPSDTLIELAFDEDSIIREAVASNSSTLPETLAELAKDRKVDVRKGVADNPSAPDETLAELILDYDEDVRRNVAGNPNATLEILTVALGDEDEYVRKAARRNLSTPGLDRMRQHSKVIGFGEPDADYEDGKKFCFDVERAAEIIEEAMRNRFPYAYWTAVIGGEGSDDWNLAVRGNGHETPTDEEKEYAFKVAEDMLTDPDFWFEVTDPVDLVYDENTSSEILAGLIDNEDVEIRRAVAYHYNASEEILRRLAMDKDAGVRFAVGSMAESPDTLTKLAKDEDAEVREAVARNEDTPPSTLAELIRDKDEDVRKAARNNLHTLTVSAMEIS